MEITRTYFARSIAMPRLWPARLLSARPPRILSLSLMTVFLRWWRFSRRRNLRFRRCRWDGGLLERWKWKWSDWVACSLLFVGLGVCVRRDPRCLSVKTQECISKTLAVVIKGHVRHYSTEFSAYACRDPDGRARALKGWSSYLKALYCFVNNYHSLPSPSWNPVAPPGSHMHICMIFNTRSKHQKG